MLSVKKPMHHHPVAVQRLLEHSIEMCRTSIRLTEGVSCLLPSQLCEFIKLYLLLPKPIPALLYVVVIGPITQLGSSSSLSWTCSISSSSSSSPSSPLLELARSLRLFPIVTIISWNFIWGLSSSILHLKLSSYLPALAEPPPLHVQLAFLHEWFLSEHNRHSISVSLHCLRIGFLVGSQPQASFSIASCTVFLGLRQILFPSPSWLHSLDGVIGWNALLICHICPAEVAKSSFLSIHHCRLCWLCCWARRWMLQDMDNMEASCIFYVKVGTFTHLEQSKVSLLTVNKLGIVRLTIQPDIIVTVSFM